jgi:hypothetical protein
MPRQNPMGNSTTHVLQASSRRYDSPLPCRHLDSDLQRLVTSMIHPGTKTQN